MLERLASLLLFFPAFTLIALYISQRIGIYYFELSPNNSFFAVSHVLGGIWVAFAISWLLALKQKKPSFIACILVAFLVGVAWEYFEIAANLTSSTSPSYLSDTLSDLVMDTIGGLVGALIASHIAVLFRRR